MLIYGKCWKVGDNRSSIKYIYQTFRENCTSMSSFMTLYLDKGFANCNLYWLLIKDDNLNDSSLEKATKLFAYSCSSLRTNSSVAVWYISIPHRFHDGKTYLQASGNVVPQKHTFMRQKELAGELQSENIHQAGRKLFSSLVLKFSLWYNLRSLPTFAQRSKTCFCLNEMFIRALRDASAYQ